MQRPRGEGWMSGEDYIMQLVFSTFIREVIFHIFMELVFPVRIFSKYFDQPKIRKLKIFSSVPNTLNGKLFRHYILRNIYHLYCSIYFYPKHSYILKKDLK